MRESDFPDIDSPQPHLDEDFSKELSFQVWSTKGARFFSNRRLLAKQKWSTYALTALSTYVIILNLMIVYGVLKPTALSNTVVAFSSTALSILILIVSLLESSRRYELQASNFHRCSLELGQVYRRVRMMRTGPEPRVTRDQVEKLASDYEQILAAFENHDEIDFLMFQRTKAYFKLAAYRKAWTIVRWYFETFFVYHAVVFSPLFLAAGYLLWQAA